MSQGRIRALAAGICLACVGPAAAQHSDTPADVASGGRLYQTTCAGCHGPDGDGVPGVDIGDGRFRSATADDGLIRIIINGIPDTAMPPGNFSDAEARTIVAYLRSLAAGARLRVEARGDPARGRVIVERTGRCLTCHAIGRRGSQVGPDLTGIGAERRPAELETALLDPDAEVLDANRAVRVVTVEGTIIEGRLLNQDTFTLQILDSNERLRSLAKAGLRAYALRDDSPMPSYRDRLSPQEVADVVSYLASLGGRP